MANQNNQPAGTSIVGETDAQGNKIISYDGIFPTISGKVKLPEFDTAAMAATFVKLAGKNENCPEGWTTLGTSTDFNKINGIDELAQAMVGVIVAASRELKLNVKPEDSKLMLWATVMRQDGYQPIAMHPGSTFSGVFWLQGDKNSAPLMLMSPLRHFKHNEARPERVEDTGPFTADQMFVSPEPGELMFWPSWIEYQSPKHNHKIPRVAMHFSVQFPFIPTSNA